MKIKGKLAKTEIKEQMRMNKEDVELDEQFDYIVVDKDNKIVGRQVVKMQSKSAKSL